MKISILLLVFFVSGCSVLDHASYHRGAPGYLDITQSMYDGSVRVSLEPASLFDPDDSVAIFRLGFYWESKMKEEVYFIITVPVGGISEYENLKTNIGDLQIKNDNRKLVLKKTKSAIAVDERDLLITKEYKVKIRYLGNKKLLGSMLQGKNVIVKVAMPGKSYEGRFDINSEQRRKYKDIKNNAYNGAVRFIEAVNK